jgi:hypothetical protein
MVGTITAHVTGGTLTSCDVATIPSHHADQTRESPTAPYFGVTLSTTAHPSGSPGHGVCVAKYRLVPSNANPVAVPQPATSGASIVGGPPVSGAFITCVPVAQYAKPQSTATEA